MAVILVIARNGSDEAILLKLQILYSKFQLKMGKKHKKQLKELQRLQALHQDANQSDGDFSIETQVTTVSVSSVSGTLTESTAPSAVVSNVQEHGHVKKDLVFLTVLIVVMLAALIALNWAIDNTALGAWLLAILN